MAVIPHSMHDEIRRALERAYSDPPYSEYIAPRPQPASWRIMCGVCGDDVEHIETLYDPVSDSHRCLLSCHGQTETRNLPHHMIADHPGGTVELIAFAEWEK